MVAFRKHTSNPINPLDTIDLQAYRILQEIKAENKKKEEQERKRKNKQLLSDLLNEIGSYYKPIAYLVEKENGNKNESEKYEKILQSLTPDQIERFTKIYKQIRVIKDKAKKQREREKNKNEEMQRRRARQEDRDSRNITKKIREALSQKPLSLSDAIAISIYKNIQFIDSIISYEARNVKLEFNTEALYYIWAENLFTKELYENFHCGLVEGNNAWISKSMETGKVQYFSKNEETGEFFHFDVLTLLEIRHGFSFYEAFEYITRKCSISTREREWEMDQSLKYMTNLRRVDYLHGSLQKDYPTLYKLIGKYLPILREINTLGLLNLNAPVDDLSKEATFFSSLDHIARGSGFKPTNMNKVVNLFTLLGLVNKVAEGEVPVSLLKRAKKQSKVTYGNMVNFYTVPTYSLPLLAEAEYRANYLRAKGITMSSISVKKLQDAGFDDETIDLVFPNLKTVTKATKNSIETPLTEEESNILNEMIDDNDVWAFVDKNESDTWELIGEDESQQEIVGVSISWEDYEIRSNKIKDEYMDAIKRRKEREETEKEKEKQRQLLKMIEEMIPEEDVRKLIETVPPEDYEIALFDLFIEQKEGLQADLSPALSRGL